MGKILIIADLAEKKQFAIPRGLELAKKCGHTAEVLAFSYAPLKRLKIRASEHAGIKKRLLEDRKEAVEALVSQHAAPGQKVSVKALWEKDLAGAVSKRCDSGSYELVVKTGNRSESLTYTPTDWQLLRECPAPVMLVADKKWHRTKCVLAALDLGTSARTKLDLNHRILEIAKPLAEQLDAKLKIISAIEIPTLLADMDLVDPHTYVKQAKEEMRPVIKELARRHGLPETAFRLKRGPVEKVITSDAASVRAQLVVMGTRARTGVKAKLLGNTAERVLSHLHTDVLALKP
jgi:universal stress protein E